MTVATDARLALHWFENQVLPSLRSAPNPLDWLVANRNQLVRVDNEVPGGILTIRAIVAEWQEASSP